MPLSEAPSGILLTQPRGKFTLPVLLLLPQDLIQLIDRWDYIASLRRRKNSVSSIRFIEFNLISSPPSTVGGRI